MSAGERRVAGWMAAHQGEPRDAAQSAEWLEAFDAHNTLMAAEPARLAKVAAEREAYRNHPDTIAATRRIMAKVRARKRCGLTPRSL